jgi:hypothetical protein
MSAIMTAVVKLVVAVGVLMLVGLGAFAVVRAVVPDYGRVNRHTLDASLTRETGGGSALGPGVSPCRRAGAGAWSCDVADSSGSGGGATYRLTMRDEHCWRAIKTRREVEGQTLPIHASGCVLGEDEGVKPFASE